MLRSAEYTVIALASVNSVFCLWMLVGKPWLLRRRERIPPLPDTLVYPGWRTWHEHEGQVHEWQWTESGWMRLKTAPIDIEDIEELP